MGLISLYTLCEFNVTYSENKKLANDGHKDEIDDGVKQGLLAAYRRFMGPLVRILIRNGISFNEFADELKGVFVEVAQRDFPIDERNPSGTRIAILTGLTRKEVKRQLELIDGLGARTGTESNRVIRVLDGWHSDADFTGPYGLPLELLFDDIKGHVPSFTELVRRHSGDMSPRAMLDELKRLGAVELLPDNSIRALTKTYISSDLDPEVLVRMGAVIKNLAETLDYNFNQENSGDKKRFERSVYTSVGITPADLEDFSSLVGDKGQLLLETLDNFLSSHEGKSSAKEDANIKTGVEIYHYIETD